jgi:deoxyribodipyrimidine photo-lyase
MRNSCLLWYRNDLRLHDHEPLLTAIRSHTQVIPFYCVDPRQFGKTAFGFPKTGAFRAQFLLESIADLRRSLQARGSDLIIRRGHPEMIIPQLVKSLHIDAVYFHAEVAAEEVAVEKDLKTALALLGTTIKTFWGSTLFHPQDLPFEINDIPEHFTHFRKQVEKSADVRPCQPSPHQLPALSEVEPEQIPTLSELKLDATIPDSRGVLLFKGGETTGLGRLNDYIWQQDCLKVYKETRNGMLGANYSSKFSPWLALGCLSPHQIYEQVQAYESKRIANDSTYWLVFELLWRDYFRFICAKHGNTIFCASGLQRIPIPWKQDWERFELWQEGKTGFPLVDANMRELNATGFISNRGRQNVASFLTKNLGIDWRMGAEWFESRLIDYDVCSNWGNWNYTAGVGNDARGFRFFNILKQSNDYDPHGQYVKHWLPELAKVPVSKVHEPWTLLPVEQSRFEVQIGVDYPQPVVNLIKSAKANEQLYNAAIERYSE